MRFSIVTGNNVRLCYFLETCLVEIEVMRKDDC